jgi:hypothetical protein
MSGVPRYGTKVGMQMQCKCKVADAVYTFSEKFKAFDLETAVCGQEPMQCRNPVQRRYHMLELTGLINQAMTTFITTWMGLLMHPALQLKKAGETGVQQHQWFLYVSSISVSGSFYFRLQSVILILVVCYLQQPVCSKNNWEDDTRLYDGTKCMKLYGMSLLALSQQWMHDLAPSVDVTASPCQFCNFVMTLQRLPQRALSHLAVGAIRWLTCIYKVTLQFLKLPRLACSILSSAVRPCQLHSSSMPV